ncbi:MAG: carboxylating nicotinate-nucleotide diphosphorylase [Promethearchaeota archaeon]
MTQNDASHFGSVQYLQLISKLFDMLEEDVGYGDITTAALIHPAIQAKARIFSRQNGLVAGVELIADFLSDLGIQVSNHQSDGTRIKVGETILEARGSAATFLTVERTILNLLQRMSGIATLTAKMIAIAKGVNPKIRIAATRKTAPLLRVFDKLAVIAGGGDPHRWRLDDAVLIKDNHLALTEGISQAVRRAREKLSFTSYIEIEVKSLEEALLAAQASADAILLDNMSPSKVAATVEAIREMKLPKSPIIEVSGNISLENIAEYAATNVDVISVGALTHSVTGLDLSMDITPLKSTSSKGGRNRK